MNTEAVVAGLRPNWTERKALFTQEERTRMADECTSVGIGEARMCASFDLTAEELADLLLDLNIERCPTCRWFADAGELLNDDQVVDGHCDNCRPAH